MVNFELKFEYELKYTFFFRGKNKDVVDNEILDDDDKKNVKLGLLKKNYILVTKDNKLIVKNLGMKRKSTSFLSRKIFWDYMSPKIVEFGECKFSKAWIKNLVLELLEKDINYAAMRYSVGEIKQYKKSLGGIHSQIAMKYGSGIHFLIPNTRYIGIGKDKRYCTLEEFKQHNLHITDIDLTNVFKELDYFTMSSVTKNIFDF